MHHTSAPRILPTISASFAHIVAAQLSPLNSTYVVLLGNALAVGDSKRVCAIARKTMSNSAAAMVAQSGLETLVFSMGEECREEGARQFPHKVHMYYGNGTRTDPLLSFCLPHVFPNQDRGESRGSVAGGEGWGVLNV